MTLEEAKAAFMAGTPVTCGGIDYKCISALIYRNNSGHIEMTLELKDKRANSVTIADKERVYTTNKNQEVEQ